MLVLVLNIVMVMFVRMFHLKIIFFSLYYRSPAINLTSVQIPNVVIQLARKLFSQTITYLLYLKKCFKNVIIIIINKSCC